MNGRDTGTRKHKDREHSEDRVGRGSTGSSEGLQTPLGTNLESATSSMLTFPTGLTKDQSTEALSERRLQHVTEPGTQAAEMLLASLSHHCSELHHIPAAQRKAHSTSTVFKWL